MALQIRVPSYLPKMRTVEQMRIFTSADFDASLGSSNALGVDGFARQGYLLFAGLQKDLISCVAGRSTLQTTVALSTCEAELTSCSFSARNLLGLYNMLSIIFEGATHEVPEMHGDNQAANRIGACQSGLRNHRHLRLPDLWIRNLTKDERIRIYDKRSQVNSSDVLTKVLTEQTLQRLLPLIGLQPLGSS